MKLEALATCVAGTILLRISNLASAHSTIQQQEMSLSTRERSHPRNRTAGRVALMRRGPNPINPDALTPPEMCGKQLFDGSICPVGTFKYVCDQTVGYYHGTEDLNTPATAGGGPRCHTYVYINKDPPACPIGFCDDCKKETIDGLSEGIICSFTYERGDGSDGYKAFQCQLNNGGC